MCCFIGKQANIILIKRYYNWTFNLNISCLDGSYLNFEF